MSCLGKIDEGTATPVRLPIIGHTIGNLIASQETQASQAGANSASAPGSAAGTGATTSSDPIGDLIAQYAGPTPAELASGQWSSSGGASVTSTVSAPADSTTVAEVVVTAQRNSSNYDSGYNPAYFQYTSNINGGRHNPSPLDHFLYAPFPGIPSQATNILQRTAIYGSLNQSLNSPGSVYNTSFFNAASNVTGITGLSGAQYLSLITDTVGVNYPYDPTTLNNVEALGEGLYKNVNAPLYAALYNGNDNFVLQNGAILGSVAGGSTQDLNYALVHNEQTYVQNFLDNLPADQRASFITESNNALKNFLTPSTITSAIQNLGHPFDFGNQSDREAIGRAEVNVKYFHTESNRYRL